jgi:YYY domain-containing protein
MASEGPSKGNPVLEHVQALVARIVGVGQKRWLGVSAVIWLLILVLLIGGYLRLSHINWDQDTHIHPDERFLTMVEDALDLPTSFAEFADSTRSPLNPYNKGYGFFVYGTLPIFLVRIAAEVLHRLNQTAHIWMAAGGVTMDLIGYGGVHFVGRALSGLFDLGCVALIFFVARRLYDWRVGLLAALLLSFSALPLQQSHFFTVDTFGSFFALLTFYFAVRVLQGGQPGRRGGGWLTYVAMGASLGASIACRINLAPLAGIALLAAGVRAWDDWQRAAREEGHAQGGWLNTLIQATLFRLLLMGIVAFAVFRVAQPYAFGGTTLADFSLSEQWRDNMRQIRLLMSGDADTPPGHQWANRTPFVFPFVNMVVWGMGLPLGIAAWVGWAFAALQVIRCLTSRVDGAAVRAHLLPVAWIGGLFLWQGMQYVQSMRYLLPIYPMLAMMAAWLLWWLVDWARARHDDDNAIPGTVTENVAAAAITPVEAFTTDLGAAAGDDRGTRSVGTQHVIDQASRLQTRLRDHAPALAYGLMAVVTIGTLLWGWGFLAIYRRPLTRITASRWIYENLPPGTVIANEHWDDGLPLRIDGKDGFGSFGYRGLSSSSDSSMQMYAEDTPEKREQLYQWLNEADYIVLSSNRLWGSIPRLPTRYPMTTLYYELLFAGKLGFEQVLRTTSFPTIFWHPFDDTWAEEAFSVYDHPEVRIYRKTPQYSEALVRSYLDSVDLEHTIQVWPKQVSASPDALMMTPERAAEQQAGGTWSRIFDVNSLMNRSPLLSTLVWLLMIEALGLLAFPLLFLVAGRLADRGYGVAKMLGIAVLGWLSWIAPALGLVPFERWWIAVALVVSGAAAIGIAWSRKDDLREYLRQRWGLLMLEEVLFLGLFLLFLVIRWGNPDLWHPARGGEKPMDFAYLNAVIKSTYFPPFDPWHAGGYMNYYYFGLVLVGALVKLLGIVPWVAYNLVVPTLFALTGLGAFCVAYNLVDGDPGTVFPGEEPSPFGLRIGSLLSGLAGAFFVAIVGNLGNVRLLIQQVSALAEPALQASGPGLARFLGGLFRLVSGQATLSFPNDWWFWNASRVIPDTINEFPFFTFTYGDLHAHMIALPVTLLGLALAVALVRLADRVPGTSSERLEDGGANQEPSPWRVSLAELWLLLLLGFVVGSLRAINTWDFPTYILIGLIAIGVLEANRRLTLPFPEKLADRLAFLFRSAVAVLWRTAILVLTASLLFYPYTKYYATAYAGLQRYKEATTKLPDYLTVWGFFLALVAIYLISELIQQARDRSTPRWIQALLPAIIVAVIVLIGAGWVLKARIWLIALPLAVLSVTLSLGREIPPSRRFVLLLIGLALAITMGVEVVRQKDDIGRMNTVFKLYLQAWVLLAIASAVGLANWIPRSFSWRLGWRRAAWAVSLILFLGVMLYPPFAARAKVRDRFSAEDSPHTLDGIAYMDKAEYSDNNRDLELAADKAAILWMLNNVQGSPVILEGVSPGYRWGNRFSIYTGLPAVQGWDWHQKQQRSVIPSTVIDRRLADVAEIYNTVDLARAQKLLDHYGVEYIIIGGLEHAYYTPEGLAKFESLVDRGYLELVYPAAGGPGSEAGAVRIYRVVGRGNATIAEQELLIGPQPVPTPTGLPEPEDGQMQLPSSEPFESPKG